MRVNGLGGIQTIHAGMGRDFFLRLRGLKPALHKATRGFRGDIWVSGVGWILATHSDRREFLEDSAG